MSDLAFTTRTLNDHCLVIEPGRTLDNTNAHEMVETIMSAQERGFRFLIIDLAAVELLSSAGVGSILGTIEGARERGGDIVLCNASEPIMHVLQVLDLVEYLTIAPNESAAVVRCGGGG